MSAISGIEPTFSETLPESSFEEGGYKRVREVKSYLAEAIRRRFDARSEARVEITEMQVFGGMFEPPEEDECDLIISCDGEIKGFFGATPEICMDKMLKWVLKVSDSDI